MSTESADRKQGAAWHSRPELQGDFAEPKLRSYLAAGAPASVSSLRLDNRVAFIGDGELASALSRFAHVALPLPGDLLESARPDLLLIGGDWPRAGEPWRDALLNVSASAVAQLRGLIARYKALGVPSALWITGEVATVDAYRHLLDAVDAVFVPSGTAIAGARTLDAGIDVKTHNPFKEDADTFLEDSPWFRFAIDGVHELSQLESLGGALDLLRPLLRFNTWLIDSSYHYQSATIKVHPIFRRRFLGRLEPGALSFLTKAAYGLFLASTMALNRPAHFRTRAFQAAACKTLVLTDGAGPDGTGILRCRHGDELCFILTRLLDDEVARIGMAHLAWREVLSSHTLFERLETILTAVDVTPVYSAPARPAVNIVMSTVRPELVPYVLEMYRRQTYESAHLTVVANGVSVPADISRLVHDTANATLCSVPADRTLGYCMNFGIDQVDTMYWAKWDDDDIYGPHFLEDQMLQRKYVDFDVAGKAAIFNYFEERDSMHTRNFHLRDTLSRHVEGGTLLVRNDNRPFPEGGRGGEDKAFVFMARERGDRIVAGDPFNFVQVRRADRSSHTWTRGAHAFNLRGAGRPGLCLENIIL